MHQLMIAFSLFLLMLASVETTLIYSAEKYDELAAATNMFGLNLHRKLSETEQGNIVFSPVSISFALALTSLGARGNTLEEIRKAIVVSNVPGDKIHNKYKAFMEDIIIDDDKIRVNLANRLFVNISFPILPEFLDKSHNFYGAKAESVDFGNTEEASSIVNNWVSEKTHKKITSIIKAKDIDPLTVLVLVNAIYFKSDWEVGFEKKYTMKQDFHAGPDVIVQTDFLHSPQCDGVYGINENLHFEVFEKYFYGKEFSFGIILPDLTKTSLENVEKYVSPDAISLMKLEKHFVNVTFPKFKFEKSIDLNLILENLGIHDMFGYNADFTGINSKRDLFVSKVFHKAIVDVNEEGAEAAASTIVKTNQVSGSIMLPSIINFRADHPFLFYIKHIESHSFLFFGRYSKP